ncbi:uncharacterized protein LOC125191854 isoform X2 [Salvia hispanica]|uniref:uncharacterized protein LOC125191854 isoform X2 n=2 Tax=Salvia hispanica TaxID=49212 RepID=UPI002008F468|nr:uncharacterized protein LOC125191854 isoform X2 [Salvia hispanica]XP_047945238.1 uncharacterized protein LOC125191854 isoform X2 [Salvia hispanica]
MVETRGSATSSKEGRVYERSTEKRKTEAKREPTKGQVVKELARKGLALEGADTRSKCTTQNVKNPLSLNALHAISISKWAEATKRSKLIGGTVGSKDVDKEASAKKTTGCGVEHEKNSSDSIPEQTRVLTKKMLVIK